MKKRDLGWAVALLVAVVFWQRAEFQHDADMINHEHWQAVKFERESAYTIDDMYVLRACEVLLTPDQAAAFDSTRYAHLEIL